MMSELNPLVIEHTNKTPQIDLNNLTGDLIFSGKSIPENAARVYEPVFSWITQYILNARSTTNLRLNLEYFNTSSLLWLTKILKELIKIHEPDYVLIINLYMPVEDFDEISDFDDIKDAFLPVSNIIQSALPCIGLKLYGTNDDGGVIKETLVFFEPEQFVNLKAV
jgi:hypothetical protein